MATTIVLKAFSILPDGRVQATLQSSVTGETIQGFNSVDAVAQDVLLAETEAQIFRYFWAYWLARNPTLSNPNILLNKEFIVDFSHANPMRVQG